jgi:pyruvate formate lyase activating enzyme
MNPDNAAAQSGSLHELLATAAREGELYQKLPGDRVLCTSCGHRCRIPPGRDGICRVRSNRAGVLYVPAGYVAGLALDPIE